jgi:triosephosphate isomerase (TIM)
MLKKEKVPIEPKLIVANWKMNKTITTTHEFISKFTQLSENKVYNNAIVCPPSTLLYAFKDSSIITGAQDCSSLSHSTGAFTGDISTNMLQEFGCKYVIIGHSEKRKYHQESDQIIQEKISNAHKSNLIAILCIGETLSQREDGSYKQELLRQLEKGLPDSANNINTVIAYEPVWAIGTGKTANIEQIKEVHKFLSEKSLSRFAQMPKIIYGGSVNLENAETILNTDYVSGLLIGGASLEAQTFYNIIKIGEEICS